MPMDPLQARLADWFNEGIRRGWHLGAQASVSLRGRLVADLAVGEAAPGVPMRPETLMLWMSAGKPVTALGVAALWEEGRLDLDRPVAAWLPEFAAGGKQDISLRHILTHTGGFRAARFRYPAQDWDEVIAAICASPLESGWQVGVTAAYHPQTSWFILGEAMRRASGEEVGPFLKRRLLDPLGMEHAWLGMPEEVYDDYAESGLLALMPTTAIAALRPTSDTTMERPGLVVPRPSGNFAAPARDMRRLYEGLLAGGQMDGVRALQPATVAEWTRKHRRGAHDQTFRRVVDFGLGFVCDSKEHLQAGEDPDGIPYGYGRHASPLAVGHSGYQSSVAFCDPAHGLAAAVVFNGYNGEQGHQERVVPVLRALYEETGLA